MIDKLDVENDEVFIEEKQNVKVKVPNAINIVMIMCIIIAALLFLGEITLTFGSLINVSLMVAIIYLIASIAYRTNYQKGMYAAAREEEYIKTKEAYEGVKNEIYTLGIAPILSDYCIKYTERDLKAYRTSILADACVRYEQYEKEYMNKSYQELVEAGVSKAAAKCISRANKAEGIKLNTNMLLSADSSARKHRGLGMSTSTKRKVDFTTNMFFRFVTTLLSGTVVVDVVINPSWQALAQWLIRMIAVFWAAVSGYNAGVKNISETTVSYLSRKTEILKIFIAWYKKEQGV